MAYFEHDGQRIAYTVYGDGPRVTLLLPGLLLSQRMQEPLARELAERGERVIVMDPLGHGRSDRPRDMWRYSMTTFGGQAIALLDALEIEQAVIGGTSLGANVTLEVAAARPERVRGMLLEMPVLDNALLGAAIAFTPLLVALTFGEPIMRVVQHGAKLVRRVPLPFLGEIAADWLAQDPGPSAAVLQGLFFGRIAPHRDIRRTLEAPALVIGHPRDPVHPFSDAGMLASELPNGHLLNADSIVELRTKPERLTGEIAAFVEACWAPKVSRAASARRRPTGRRAAPPSRRRPRAASA
jgi:pimeloyl-ACP methyl ester carboxylesterase